MPGFAVQVGATIICAHAGQAQPLAPNPRVVFGGQPSVTMTSPYVIAGCALTGTPNPPCVTAQILTGATRVLAGGAPLVLFDSQSICTPTGTPMTVLVTQVRVKAT